MANSIYKLKYPKSTGFDKTVINFYEGSPNLNSVYPEVKGGKPRLFVTDNNVASLDSIKSFICDFKNSIGNSFEKVDSSNIKTNIIFSGKRGNDILIVLKAGEAYKTTDSIFEIEETALNAKLDRGTTFIAIGGGVITDMTAFAASIYKRGVKVEFVPTTLLAMVDAATGGKTGCDYNAYKNVIGAFWPADNLHIWSDFVLSLPESEYRSGMAEAIKTAFLFNKKMITLFESSAKKIGPSVPAEKRDKTILNKIIRECVKEKSKTVQKDFRERSIRAYLNLGHTFGHALETVSGLGEISHGEAVAWGMARAAELGKSLKITDETYADRVIKILKEYGYDTKPYPDVLSSKSNDKSEKLSNLLLVMHNDKKNVNSTKARFILQKKECSNFITEIEDEDVRKILW